MNKQQISKAIRDAYDYVKVRPAVIAAISVALIIIGWAMIA